MPRSPQFGARRRIIPPLLLGLLLIATGCNGGGGPGTGNASGGGGTNAGGVDDGDGAAGGGGGGGGGGDGGGGGGTGGGDTPTTGTPDNDGSIGGSGTTGGGGGGGNTAGVTLDPGNSAQTTRARADFSGTAFGSGIAFVPATVQNTTSFQIVVQAPTDINAQLQNSLGQPVVFFRPDDGSRQQTLAVFVDSLVNSMPYPTNGFDPPIVSGVYTEALVFASGAAAFTGRAIAKNDPTPNSGLLRVNLFLVGASLQTDPVRNAIDDAVDVWRSIYSSVGITLDIALIDIDGPAALPDPNSGSNFYLTNSRAVRTDALNVFVGEDITGFDGTTGFVLGVASSIPGPNVPSPKTAVAISFLNHQSIGGTIDTGVLGETIAHEGGHYLGLFHPVEIDSGNSEATYVFVEGDRLTDTPVCTASVNCRANGLAGNLMFPTALPGVLQRSISGQQGQVLNLQVMVD